MKSAAPHAGPLERLNRESSVDHLFSATYEELRRLAGSVRRGDSSETLNPTALVNEAYLKLAGSKHVGWRDREHFVYRVEPLEDSVARARALGVDGAGDGPVVLLDHYDTIAHGQAA